MAPDPEMVSSTPVPSVPYTVPAAPPAGYAPRASFGRRFFAYVLDAILIAVAFGIVELALFPILAPGFNPLDVWLSGDPDAIFNRRPFGPNLLAGIAVLSVLEIGLTLAYFTLFEARLGWTPGKRALDLRVAREDGRPVTTRESIVRAVGKVNGLLLFLDFVIGYFAYGEAKQRVTDHLVGTTVIRERGSAPQGPPP